MPRAKVAQYLATNHWPHLERANIRQHWAEMIDALRRVVEVDIAD